MPVASANFGPLLEPGLRKVFFQSYRDLPEQYSVVATVKKSKKATETDYQVAGIGEWDVKESMGSAATDVLRPGEEIDYTHEEYAKQCQVERKFIDDEMYDVVNKLPNSLGKGARQKAEKIFAEILNNGFSNTGYDSVSLFSDSHPRYGAIGGTVNNLHSGALSDATVKTGITLARKMTDDAGMKIQWGTQKRLVVPVDLEWTAIKITQSPLESDTTDNNVNALKGLKHFVMDYLTSTTAWFLQDPTIESLIFYWRIRPEFNKDKEFTTMLASWLGYERFSCGYSDFRGWVGSPGT